MRRYIFLATVLALLAAPTGAARAKERTAGCAGFPRALLRIESAIHMGANVWNAGNQLATYAIYRDVTQQILKELVTDQGCGPLHDVLQGALERAHKAATPGSAGWDLRHGFDTFIDFAGRGEAPKLYPPVGVDRVVAPYYGEGCRDLFALVQRAEHALGGGQAEAEARAMVRELGANGACPHVLSALTLALKKKEPAAALDRLAAGQAPPGDPEEPPAILRRCPLLPSLVEEITFAIARGAPRYDDGRPDLCLAIYRKTAESALSRYAQGGRCEEAAGLLRKGLAEAKREHDESKGAWALRHAFDAIGQAFVRAIPQ